MAATLQSAFCNIFGICSLLLSPQARGGLTLCLRHRHDNRPHIARSWQRSPKCFWAPHVHNESYLSSPPERGRKCLFERGSSGRKPWKLTAETRARKRGCKVKRGDAGGTLSRKSVRTVRRSLRQRRGA